MFNAFAKWYLCLLKGFLFLNIRRLYIFFGFYVKYIWKKVKISFWAHFFWVPIPFKRYQNTSGWGTAQHHCFAASIKLDTSNVFTRIIPKILLWCIAKLKFALKFTGMNILKYVIKGFKFVFSDFFPCRLNFCFATEITLKIGCLCNTWKTFRAKQKNQKCHVQPYK